MSQPDRPAGRGGKLTPTPIAAFAAASLPSVPLIKPAKCNTPEVIDLAHGWGADAWVVIAFGQKLGKKLLGEMFAINLHASLLPRWRGAAPIHAAILAGDRVTGNSVITLADTMDAGLVLGQSRRDIPPDMNTGQLHDLLAADGPALVEEVLQAHAGGSLKPVTQDESLVTLAGKLSRADAWVDFAQSAELCRRRINGLSPWPGVTVKLRGDPLRLLRASTADEKSLNASELPHGALIDADMGLIRCGDGTMMRLLEVQPAGRTPMPWDVFARGRRPTNGEVLVGDAPA